MLNSRVSLVIVAIAAFVAGGIVQPFHVAQSTAQPGCRTFPETSKTVCGQFLTYWDTHGGLAQQGLPLSGEFTEVSDLNGQAYTVQYFERAVFEKHPANKPPYDVLLSQLGTFRFKAKYPNGELAPRATPTPNPFPTGTVSPDPRVPIQVSVGQQFTITKTENGSIGYTSRLSSAGDQGVIQLVSDTYKPNSPTPVPGEGGTHIWVFKAAGAGDTTIVINNYYRSSTPNSQEVFTIIVR